ncbi:hypothetical protein T440DRAFT_469220 [Plenodomus tracheiphilus IPT5]|uniref:Uncharacterized protein n=1 Tax=Plenodomus tracheiphilus IPT5 TaxID=1408161 RepID=A0A6A7B1R1_9PLEO|nr:hypothetical protein T440DRAFT_469220 [Plenodomus tracheiphilus IPT5]
MDSSSRQPRKWTVAEDQILREEVEAQLINGDVRDWCRIADQLPGRTNKDCRKRWHNSVAGGLKKGQWSKSEDELLTRGVEEYGQKWTLVANCVTSRSADQCAKRWQQSLDPELDRSEWLESEDKTLIDATQRLGRHWKDIQREHFPGRSKNCIKNRYTVLVRRYQNQGIQLPDAASSPSESSTPAMSSYPEEDDYLGPAPNMYNDLLSAPKHATSSRSRHSWSSMDNDAYATWSTASDYNMPIAMTSTEMYHTTNTMPQFALTQPPVLVSNASHASSSSHWSTPAMQSTIPMHTQSPITTTTMQTPFYGYEQFSSSEQPMMTYDPSYTASTARANYAMPNQSASPMPRSRSPSQNQPYPTHISSPTYHDPMYPHNPPYHY